MSNYSLVQQPWIPVATPTRRRVFVRPCDITTPIDGEPILHVDTGRPDFDISLAEFLIGLLAITMGPDGRNPRQNWLARYRDPPTRDELESALQPFAHAFNLDGDGPRFFQDFEQLDDRPVSIAALFIDSPGDKTIAENADHFVKRGRIGVLSRAAASIALLTLQTSAPSGGAGHRTSLRGGGPLTTLIVPGTDDGSPPTLWQRLWSNVPINLRAKPEDAPKVFPWLGKTRVSDKTGVTTTPEDVHAGQAFFGMPRRINLVLEKNVDRQPCDLLGEVDTVVVRSFVTRPWGTNYTAWSRGHPLSPYYKVKKTDTEFLPLHLKSSHIGYRQWIGMILETPDNARVPAAALWEFSHHRAGKLTDKEQEHIRVLVAGYAMDNMKPLEFAEALLPLVVTGDNRCDSVLGEIATRLINSADSIATQLGYSVKLSLYGARSKVDRESSVLEAVRDRFWGETEDDFYRVVHNAVEIIESNKDDLGDLADDLVSQCGGQWLAILMRNALRIFDETVSMDDADSDRIEEVIAGRKQLVLALSGHGKHGKSVFGHLRQHLSAESEKIRKKGGERT